MIWRAGKLLLATATEDAASAVIDQSGALTFYEPRTASDEDDLWRWKYVVVGDRFYERTTVETAGACRHEDKLLLEGLVPVDDPETQAFVVAAFARDREACEQAVTRAEREGDMRIAAIPGGITDLGLGDELGRAQTALADRVRRYDDRLAAALLQSLVELAAARPDASVIAAYARGCLHACFISDVPPVTDATSESDPELAAELSSRARELDTAADDCERSDSLGNARAYRAAARAVWLAVNALTATI